MSRIRSSSQMSFPRELLESDSARPRQARSDSTERELGHNEWFELRMGYRLLLRERCRE